MSYGHFCIFIILQCGKFLTRRTLSYTSTCWCSTASPRLLIQRLLELCTANYIHHYDKDKLEVRRLPTRSNTNNRCLPVSWWRNKCTSTSYLDTLLHGIIHGERQILRQTITLTPKYIFAMSCPTKKKLSIFSHTAAERAVRAAQDRS